MPAIDESFPLYVWSEPKGLSAEAGAALIEDWRSGGGDPAWSPFKPSTDLAGFYRELTRDLPEIDALCDGERSTRSGPRRLGPDTPTDTPRPARIVVVRVTVDRVREELEKVYGLAAKYHLVVYDLRMPAYDRAYAAMAAAPGVAFWPFEAVRAIVAGAIAALVAYGAWIASIPVISGLVAVVGAFFALLGVVTIAAETRSWWRRRRRNGPSDRGAAGSRQ